MLVKHVTGHIFSLLGPDESYFRKEVYICASMSRKLVCDVYLVSHSVVDLLTRQRLRCHSCNCYEKESRFRGQ